MLNNRIQEILQKYQLSASNFAEKIGVPRSSISHIISGRNKPSLDFVLKTVEAFPEVDLHWLLYGKGVLESPESLQDEEIQENSLTDNSEQHQTMDLFSQTDESNNQQQTKVSSQKSTKKTEAIKVSPKPPTTNINISESKELEKIVFFYKDGSFKEFSPERN